MAQITYRANLSSKSFPFISDNWGRTIIVPQYDNTFNRQVASLEDSDRDVGIPQIYYCHNVVPNAQGFQSVGYTSAIVGNLSGFNNIYFIRDDQDRKAFLSYNLNGDIYVAENGVWEFKASLTSFLLTTTYVSGVTYIYIQGGGCYTYNFDTHTLDPVTLTGLDVNSIIGICGSQGYLIAWSISAVAWSSTIDPTDFTPSLTTGAGGGGVEGARGAIQFCVANGVGFMAYTTKNVVAAIYSGNARFPFNFREVVASGGISSLKLIAFEANSGAQYAYTTSGLQLISSSSASLVFPDATDFISGRLFEDFDETTQQFIQIVLTGTMVKRLNLISDRYLILSYGISSLTHALIYDFGLKRWGKLKIPHVDTLQYELYTPGAFEIPKQSVAFLQSDGSVKILDFATASPGSKGVLLTGKYQFVRPRNLVLDTLSIDRTIDNSMISVKILSSLNGKETTSTILPAIAAQGVGWITYASRIEAVNHSVLLQGQFQLDTLMLQFHIGAKVGVV